jgi:hypothetical protein
MSKKSQDSKRTLGAEAEVFRAGLRGKDAKKNRGGFRPGTHGGCEALLYEFSERTLSDSDDLVRTPSMNSRVVLIAAVTFDEAFAYLRFDSPDFNVQNVRCLGLILMVSGSPAE